jgi:signal transduction histidine kinase
MEHSMEETLRTLILEDKGPDMENIERELKKSMMEMEITRAESKDGFEKALAIFCPDIIIFDRDIPDYDGIAALKHAVMKCPEAVKICVSGKPGEEYAVEIMKNGADDYIMKNNFPELTPSINRAVYAKKEQDNRIKAKNEKLSAEQEYREKSGFLAEMGHELRTPLNSVIGFSEILHDGLYGELNAKQKEYAGFILASGKRLLSLINDILDLSKIEAGKMELKLEKLNPFDTAKSVVSMFSESTAKNNIAVLFDEKTEKNAQIEADPRLLKQVFFNLMENSVKFSKPGGSISALITSKNAGEVEFRIKCSETGMKKEEMERLFRPLPEIKSDVKPRETEVTGFGFMLTQKIIELHGGRFWVESESGTGSSFLFTMPVKQKGK